MNEPVLTAAASVRSERRPLPKVDFLNPPGAPALYAAQSVAWHVFKNPVSLFIGGITAVLLELAEERVRSGVWDHSIFRTDPILRMRRTGLMTYVSVYAPSALAERWIAGVVRMHEKVAGHTPKGTPYRANQPELLDWVQCTAGYGFLEAYAMFCRPLTDTLRDRFYAESQPSARLFLATGAPRSLAEQRAQFEAMRPQLEAHPIVFEFLDIMRRTRAVPLMLRSLQWMMVRGGIHLLPDWVAERLGLDAPPWRLRPWEKRLLMRMGALFERLPIPSSPPVQACRRLGLPASYLYKNQLGGP